LDALPCAPPATFSLSYDLPRPFSDGPPCPYPSNSSLCPPPFHRSIEPGCTCFSFFVFFFFFFFFFCGLRAGRLDMVPVGLPLVPSDAQSFFFRPTRDWLPALTSSLCYFASMVFFFFFFFFDPLTATCCCPIFFFSPPGRPGQAGLLITPYFSNKPQFLRRLFFRLSCRLIPSRPQVACGI